MSTTTISPTVRTTATRTRGTTASVLRTGALAAVVAGAAAEIVGLIARAIDVPMRAGGVGADEASAIPAGGFFFMTVFWSAFGLVLALGLARWARRPARTFVVTTIVLTAISMVGPVMAGSTTTATKVVLGLTHAVAAAVVIPAVARVLPTERTTRP